MALSDSRIAAQAAFVARRLLADGLLRTGAPSDVRQAVLTVLETDRKRDRALDEEVLKILQQNAQAIQAAGADHGEMFRKAKKMLAEKKKIPL